MSQLHQKQQMFFNIREHHYTYTMRWQHYWIGSCLSNGSAIWVPHSCLPTIQILPFSLFSCGLGERWCLLFCHCLKSQITQTIECNQWLQILNRLYIRIFDASIFFMWAGNQMQHLTEHTWGMKKKKYQVAYCNSVHFIHDNKFLYLASLVITLSLQITNC